MTNEIGLIFLKRCVKIRKTKTMEGMGKMQTYTLTKFNSVNADMASVTLKNDTGSLEITLPRTLCLKNREYVNYRGKWQRLSKYKATIKRIRFKEEANGFTVADIGILKNYTKEDIPTDCPKIKGFFPILYAEEIVDLLGFWESSNSGFYFNVITCERVVKIEAVSIINFLKAALPGMSKVIVENMVNYFGPSKIIDIIKNSPNELLKVKGIGPKAIVKIQDGVGQAFMLESIFEFMGQFDIPSSAIIEIYKEYGLKSEEVLKNNPYLLAERLFLPISDVDKIGKYLGFIYNSPERIRALIVCFLKNESENKGDMFTLLDTITENLTQYSNRFGNFKHKQRFTQEEINEALESLKNIGHIFIDHHPIDGVCIYHSYYKTVEDKICYRLYDLLTGINTRPYDKKTVDKLLSDEENNTGFKMADKQKEAVHMALKNKFSILTGGPGTGKTQSINSIIKIIEKINPGIELGLCAPTGKASKRMSELTGKNAYTIHKKLECKPFTAVEELEELTSDFLIIDEASMIDADLFYKLLTSIKDSASILLVGDYHQLPSVGVGLILRDLIESGVIPVTELTEVFRQSGTSPIIELSQNISKGNHLRQNSRYTTKKGEFYFNIQGDNRSIQREILKTIQSVVDSKIMTADMIQVLMPVNHGDIGMVILNQKIQNLLNPDIGQNKYELTPFMELRVGDRIMQTKNNYNIGVFNGSVGYIKSIEYGDNGVEMRCEFDGEEKTYTGYDEVEEVALAYAITIHKSQGSEFPLVIMPVARSYGSMLSRNLLYTAVTRAKKYLRIIGDINAFNAGVDNTEIVSRNSHIKEKLQNLIN